MAEHQGRQAVHDLCRRRYRAVPAVRAEGPLDHAPALGSALGGVFMTDALLFLGGLIVLFVTVAAWGEWQSHR